MSDLFQEAKDAAKGAMRAVKDAISPPTTVELASRAIQDGWVHAKRDAHKLDKHAQRAFNDAGDMFETFAQNPHGHARDFAKDATEFGKDFSDEVLNARGVKALIKFVKAAGHVVGAVFGTAKERDSAWKDFTKSTGDLVKSVKSALGLDSKKTGHGRH